MATISVTNASTLNTAVQTVAIGDIISVANNISLDGDGSGFQGTVVIPTTGNITINGNGFKITSATATQRHFLNNGVLILTNIILDGGSNATLTGNAATVTSGGGGIVSTNNLTLETGTIIQNCNSVQGGGVVITNGSFTMNNGAIVQYNISTTAAHECWGGGGIQVGNNLVNNPALFATAVVSGSILNNHCNGQGGGIRSTINTMLTIDGAIIDSNTSSVIGGGFAFDDGDTLEAQQPSPFIVINNTTISNNIAGNGGGLSDGIGLNGWLPYIQITGSTLKNNKTISSTTAAGQPGNGGGIYSNLAGSTIEISSTTFENNTTLINGAGLFLNSNNGNYTINQESVIENNITTGGNGGGVYQGNNSILTISNTLITENSAIAGGGYYASV